MKKVLLFSLLFAFLLGVAGCDGDRGATGPRGVDGITGPSGMEGERGERGADGIMGDQGAQGDGASCIVARDAYAAAVDKVLSVSESFDQPFGSTAPQQKLIREAYHSGAVPALAELNRECNKNNPDDPHDPRISRFAPLPLPSQ